MPLGFFWLCRQEMKCPQLWPGLDFPKLIAFCDWIRMSMSLGCKHRSEVILQLGTIPGSEMCVSGPLPCGLWAYRDEAVRLRMEVGREPGFTDEGGTVYCSGPWASCLICHDFCLVFDVQSQLVSWCRLVVSCEPFQSLLREGILYQVFSASFISIIGGWFLSPTIYYHTLL